MKMDTIISPERRRSAIYSLSLSVLLLLLYHMLYPVNFFLGKTIYDSYYWIFVIALITAYFCTRQLKYGVEIKILSAFCVWLYISRLLNGDIWLQNDMLVVLETTVCCICMPAMIALSTKDRRLFMDLLSVFVCGFCTLLAVIGIYASVFRLYIVNPLTEATLAHFSESEHVLTVLNYNRNICSIWFFMSICLLIYQLFRQKRLFIRITLGIMLLASFLTLALTYSRNSRIALSFALGILAVLILLEYVSFKKVSSKIFVSLLTLCTAILIGYFCTSFSATLFCEATAGISDNNQPVLETTEVSGEAGSDEVSPYLDTRGLADSGRLPIYKSVITDLIEQPGRLLKGALAADVMDSANKRLTTAFYHAHCSYLEILARMGIPGLLLMLAFVVRLLICMWKLFFSKNPKITLDMKVIVVPVIGLLWYNLLEGSLFIVLDIRSILFMIFAGAVVAFASEAEKDMIVN